MEIREIPIERELSERVHWLVRLRWFMGGGVLVLGLVGPVVIPRFFGRPVWILALAIFAYNACFRFSLDRLAPRLGIHLQIFLDWLTLTVLCHYTGGVESPFIFFFIFHVILASLFISRRECLLQGVFAIILIAAMSALEAGRVFVPHPLLESSPRPWTSEPVFLLIFLGSFSAVILFSIYLSATTMTALRKDEEKLLELQNNLSQAYNDLVALDREKTHFVNLVAHEIKSPLAAIQSLMKVVLEGYAGETGAKALDLIARAENRSLQLLKLVNDLLDLVRGGKLLAEEDKTDIDILGSLVSTIKEMEGLAAEKKITLNFQPAPAAVIFQGDRQDLERIFHNLLSNAISYTPAGGHVEITAELSAPDFIKIRFTDSGIGIPAEELPKIFDEFFRSTNAKKEKKLGTGLGLSIVRKSVEKYGGRIEATSELHRGSCFTVYLPVITLAS